MRKTTIIIGLIVLGLSTPNLAAQTDEAKKLREAGEVLVEMHNAPDDDIPQGLWSKAKCAIVVPGLTRAAFIVGGEHGKGAASCRKADGSWGPPAIFEITKGSVGAQIGGASIDLILLVMNDRGMERLLQSKVTLGAEATVAAGPVGRNAEAATDAQLSTEMLAWSRSKGLFAGINLSGGTLKPDNKDTAKLYGRPVAAEELLVKPALPAPLVARPFLDALRLRDAAGE